MAIPTSGSIAIISAPQTCGSICAAVGLASGSLSALSVAAGKSAPHCMREFYGYVPPTPVNMQYIYGTGTNGASTTIARCHCITPKPVGAEAYTVCLCGNLSTVGAYSGSYAKWCVTCNYTPLICCCIPYNTCCIPSLSVSVDYNDTLRLYTCVYVSNTAGNYSCARMCLNTVTGTGYCKGTTCTMNLIYTA
jgi:hypothetical protein